MKNHLTKAFSMAFCSFAIFVNAQIDDGEFILIDSNTDSPITTIFDGAIYDLNVVGDSLNIQAIPSQAYTHVKFTSSDGYVRSEGVAPYAYRGDTSGDYMDWAPVVGVLVFTIEYLNSGTVVTTDTFTISFTNGYGSGGSSPWTASGSDINYTSGNVGIGTSNPQRLLHIEQAEDPSTDYALLISEPNNSQQITLHLADNANGEYGYLGLGGETRLRGNGEPSVFEGNVGIGTSNLGSYQLAVNGTIHSKEVKVDLVGWPDYVFESNYNLPPLEEVEKHILEKGHLINIPSAEEVEDNGIELGLMNKLLLEKIEELTLYTIHQEKQLQQLVKEIHELRSMKATQEADSQKTY